MVARVLSLLLRVGVRVTVAVVAYDAARAWLPESIGAERIALFTGGTLAGVVTLIVGKSLYDTFLPPQAQH